MLIYLHRRGVRKQRKEDLADPHKSLDFGMMMDPSKSSAKAKRKSAFFGAEKETGASRRQLSMDMNLSSPYLLPPELQSSRESLHSLARTLHQNEDPYRPVAQYAGSDVASMRTMQKEVRDGSSVFTESSSSPDPSIKPRSFASSAPLVLPPRQNSLPKPPMSPTTPLPAHVHQNENVTPLPGQAASTNGHIVPLEPIIPVIETVPYPDDDLHAVSINISAPGIREPPPAAQKGLPSPPTPRAGSFASTDSRLGDAMTDRNSGAAGLPRASARSARGEPEPIGLAFTSPQSVSDSFHGRQESAILQGPFATPIVEEPQEYYGGQHSTLNSVPEQHSAPYGYEDRGRTLHRRQSSEYPQDLSQSGLDVPQFDSRRLSVGFRPLPPDELMDTEDPETRANRIRSFYKEYFEESKPEAGGQQQFGGGNAQYFEDYDANYLGETAFFDPDSNAFVMPYAQPVARRAMTPPPSGSRFPGPRAGPRVMHGSIGGMSLPGGRPRGHLRPGSETSSRLGPRPGSSASNRPGPPRAGSVMSGASARSRQPLPPPAVLNTLPTPSKLRDDSFALLGAIDFAPPPTFKDQATGRSQSPLGERRAYQLKVPASTPLVSSYDEMAALPSP